MNYADILSHSGFNPTSSTVIEAGEVCAIDSGCIKMFTNDFAQAVDDFKDLSYIVCLMHKIKHYEHADMEDKK